MLLAGLGIWVFRDAIARSWTLTRERPVRTGLLVIAAVLAAEIAPIIPAVLLSALGWMPEAGTNDANRRARRFYERCGFAVVGRRRFEVGGLPQDDVVMSTPVTTS